MEELPDLTRTADAAPGSVLPDGADLSQTDLPPIDLLTEPTQRSEGLQRHELKALGAVLVD